MVASQLNHQIILLLKLMNLPFKIWMTWIEYNELLTNQNMNNNPDKWN